MDVLIEATLSAGVVLAVVAFILAPVGVDELIRRMRLRRRQRLTDEELAREAFVDLIVASLDDDDTWAVNWGVPVSGRTTHNDRLATSLVFNMWNNVTVVVDGATMSLSQPQERRIVVAEKAYRDRQRQAGERAALLRVRDHLRDDRSKLFAPNYSG